MATPISEFPSLSLIRQGVDYRFRIKCRSLELAVRPLSIAEEDQIAQDVMESMEKLPVVRQTSIRQSMMLSIKKLEMAQSAQPGSQEGVKVFQAELQHMTPGEIDHLFKQYIAGCDRVNPLMDRLGAEDLQKIVDHLKKNSTVREMTLIESSFFHLVDLCLHLLNTGESPTDKSSG